jgi:hypothetical protein
VQGLSADPSHSVELLTLVGANLAATLVRFVLMRAWIFHPRRGRRATQVIETVRTMETSS